MIVSIIPVMVPLQVRPGDCDSFGHVNNAVYIDYLQQALAATLSGLGLADDWLPGGEHLWQARSLTADYRYASLLGEELDAFLWLVEPDPSQPVLGCEIRSRAPDASGAHQVKVRLRSRWQRLHRATGAPAPLHPDRLAGFPTAAGSQPKAFELPPCEANVRSYAWQHDAMRCEWDPFGYIQLPALYRWLEEAIFDASAQGGWPLERWQAAGYVTLQLRHDTEIASYPRRQDSIRITSRLIDVRRLLGTWCAEVRRWPDGKLLVRDFSTGVFLDLQGHPASLPTQIGHDIQFGPEPAPP